MIQKRRFRVATVAVVAAFGLVAAACAPQAPGGGGVPASINWMFEGDEVTVDERQDEIFGIGRDEPYLMQIAFKATIGEPGSATAWRVGSGANEYNDLGDGESHVLVGPERARATFNGVQPLDLLDALNPANKMDIVGVYSWAMESDLISYDFVADDFADVFKDALNATLAAGVLPTTEQALVDMIIDLLFDNLSGVFSLILGNLPVFGAGDDTLGGAVYIGMGATGVLGSAINAVLGSVSIPNTTILGDNQLPPDIQGGGLFTMTGGTSFNQTFTGADGQHTYDFLTGAA